MKKVRRLVFFGGMLFLFAACAVKNPVREAVRVGHYDRLTFQSVAIADNSMQESGEKTIFVFLPPGYDASPNRYPVLYYLHSYGGTAVEMLTFEKAIYRAMEAGQIPPFIMVGVAGENQLGGSFYVNSAYSGRWEDYIVKELVSAIDGRYRTLADAKSRGVLGFSMGGFGALHLGLKYPDTFAAVWAICPAVFIPETGVMDFVRSLRSDVRFMKAYAAAFSLMQKIPVLNNSNEDKQVLAEWELGCGGWEARLVAYAGMKDKLAGVRIVYGESDTLSWIIPGVKYLAAFMRDKTIPVELQGYPFSHIVTSDSIITDALPFFRKTLAMY